MIRSGRVEDLGGFPVGGRAGLFQTHSQQSFGGSQRPPPFHNADHQSIIFHKDKGSKLKELELDFRTQLGIVLLEQTPSRGHAFSFLFSSPDWLPSPAAAAVM